MATLQQLQFKTTAGTGTQYREGTGSQLAKLVMQGLNLASDVGNAMENQRQIEERDNRTQDETNQKFIQSKMIDYQSKNPNQNAEFYETYANKGLREDPEYLERFEPITNADGSKSTPSPTDVMKSDLYKENMNLWSTRWVKESRLTDEQLQQKADRANAKTDSLLYADLTKQIEQKQIDADYNNLDNDKKIEFNTQLKKDLEEQKFGSGFLTQEAKNRYDGVVRNISKNTLDLKYEQDKTNIVNGLNNLVKTVAIDKNTTIEDVTNMTDKANDALSTKDELKLQDVLKVTVGNISNHITANPDKFIGKTKSEILKEFPLISEIKDQSILKNLKSQIKTIDLATKKQNEIIDIVTGKMDSSVAQYSKKSDWAKTLSGAYENAADDTGRQAAIALSVKSNLPIGSIENTANEFTNGEVLDPAASFAQYSMLKQADKNNYNIRAKGYDEKALRLETIADVNGYDINTEDGYRNTLLAREKIDELATVRGYASKDKKTIDLVNETINKELESSFGSALVTTQLPQSARTNILAYTNVMLNDNPTMDVDDAVGKATDLYKKKFEATGYVDLRDAGISTARDYSALKSMLTYQSGLEVDNIEVFGDAVFVNFDGGSTKELDQQNFSMNDISKMAKNAKDNNEANVKKNKDTEFGGSLDGKNSTDLYSAGEGIYTNKDIEENLLKVSAGFLSSLTAGGKPGDRFTINESVVNAYFGVESTDHLKDNFKSSKNKSMFESLKDYVVTGANMAFNNVDTLSDPKRQAYALHGLIGKAEAVINDDGSVSINGMPMVYDFTEEDNKSLFGLGGNKDKFKAINLHFTKSNVGKDPRKKSIQMQKSEDMSESLGVSKSSINRYGLYSFGSEVFTNEFKKVLDDVKSKSSDISDDDAIEKTFDVLNETPKFKGVFGYKNKYYAFGENAKKFIADNYKDYEGEGSNGSEENSFGIQEGIKFGLTSLQAGDFTKEEVESLNKQAQEVQEKYGVKDEELLKAFQELDMGKTKLQRVKESLMSKNGFKEASKNYDLKNMTEDEKVIALKNIFEQMGDDTNVYKDQKTNSGLDLIIKNTIKNEGGYQSDPRDDGNYNSKKELVGTKFGISTPLLEKTLGRIPTAEDMKKLTKDQASKIYKSYYAKVLPGINLVQGKEKIVEALFDSSTYAPKTTAKVLQKMLGVKVDGKFGKNTAKALNSKEVDIKKIGTALQKELKRINVKDWNAFGKGWTNRINSEFGTNIKFSRR